MGPLQVFDTPLFLQGHYIKEAKKLFGGKNEKTICRGFAVNYISHIDCMQAV